MRVGLTAFPLGALLVALSSTAFADPVEPGPATPPPLAPIVSLPPEPPQNLRQDSKTQGGSAIYPQPAAARSGFTDSFLIPLRAMLAKGVITQAEYDSAMKDLADTTGVRAADQANFVLGKWSTTLYGFAEADYIYDTTQSYIEFPGNTQVARPGTYAGDHPRMPGATDEGDGHRGDESQPKRSHQR